MITTTFHNFFRGKLFFFFLFFFLVLGNCMAFMWLHCNHSKSNGSTF